MLTKRAKYLFGCQMSISNFVGSIPYHWDFKKEKLCSRRRNFRWILATTVIWTHQLITTTKLLACIQLDCSESWVQTYFHLFWVLGLMFPTFFNASTVVTNDFAVHFVNKLIQADNYLTSMFSRQCNVLIIILHIYITRRKIFLGIQLKRGGKFQAESKPDVVSIVLAFFIPASFAQAFLFAVVIFESPHSLRYYTCFIQQYWHVQTEQLLPIMFLFEFFLFLHMWGSILFYLFIFMFYLFTNIHWVNEMR